MRCREIRRRLEEIGTPYNRIELPEDTLTHIETCAECSREVEAVILLNHLMRKQRTTAVNGVASFESMRDSLQRDVILPSLPAREWWLLRPAVGIAAALLVVVAALWPWQVDTIIGYEVMVSGVEREYVEGSDQICDLLMNLGLSDADIHLLQCDTTCHFNIVHLKTESEARLVVSAVSRMQTQDVKTSIRPVTNSQDNQRIL